VIRWSAFQVSKSLDEIDKLINEVEPTLRQCGQKATQTSELSNLPGYMSEPLTTFSYKIDDFVNYLRNRVSSIRDNIPKKELEQEQNRYQQLLRLWDGDAEKAQKSMQDSK